MTIPSQQLTYTFSKVHVKCVIFLLKAFQQSLNSGQKTAEKPNFGKKSLPLHRS
jgi:hypothetical protein